MNWNPVWLPDGRLSFTSMRKGDFDVYVKDVDGDAAGDGGSLGPRRHRSGRLDARRPAGVPGLGAGRRVSVEAVRSVAQPAQPPAPHRAARGERRLAVARRPLAGLPLRRERPAADLRAAADGTAPAVALSPHTGEFPTFLRDGRHLAFVRASHVVVHRGASGAAASRPAPNASCRRWRTARAGCSARHSTRLRQAGCWRSCARRPSHRRGSASCWDGTASWSRRRRRCLADCLRGRWRRMVRRCSGGSARARRAPASSG